MPRTTACILLAGITFTAFSASAQAVTLKASHQWPSGTGDFRDEMIQMIAKDVQEAGVDLDVKVYPGASLVKPRDQWSALQKGQIDIALFPLDYAAGKHPQFSITLMPGLVKNHEQAKQISDSPYMQEIKKIMEEEGIMVLADGWLAGGFASTKNCIQEPDDIKGQVTRAAGPMFEEMLVGAGASIASMPSSEIYTAMQTGVLSAANTSSESFASYRIYELAKCLTEPGDNALWFMYEPLVMSKRSFDRLDDQQKEALLKAGEKAEAYGFEKAAESDRKTVETFKQAGVEVVTMNQQQFQDWLKIAEQTSYKSFAEEVPGGAELLEKARAATGNKQAAATQQ